MPTDGMAAEGTSQRESYDMIDEAFGPGRNAPMVAFVDVAEVAEQERMPAIQEILTDFQTTDGVVNAEFATPGVNGPTGILAGPDGKIWFVAGQLRRMTAQEPQKKEAFQRSLPCCTRP